MTAEVELQLSNGYITVIDAADLETVRCWHWHARLCRPALLYAARTTSKRANGSRKVLNIYLHRFLMNAPAGMEVHHENGDTLDNRREKNLRLVTPDEHQALRLKRHSNEAAL